jgi:hypothetical protein
MCRVTFSDPRPSRQSWRFFLIKIEAVLVLFASVVRTWVIWPVFTIISNVLPPNICQCLQWMLSRPAGRVSQVQGSHTMSWPTLCMPLLPRPLLPGFYILTYYWDSVHDKLLYPTLASCIIFSSDDNPTRQSTRKGSISL